MPTANPCVIGFVFQTKIAAQPFWLRSDVCLIIQSFDTRMFLFRFVRMNYRVLYFPRLSHF
jgi:hypothetical protein